ncbi:hypothetical protein KUTeg_022785 [Tegillarca granosa]|uniref:FAM65 N-terminal domain-containing protein n=1 Tax=Tegillarca granosa TaxID=220873 RepID=A0ABQ9E5E0_TEGGR|nr:hypothetical protein KUTeg_022785 [Tegillarca granosa]
MSTRSASSSGAPVLGETMRGRGHWLHKSPQTSRSNVALSFRKSPKVPKIPRPNRTILMFDFVKKGVREFIDTTKDDIEQLHSRGIDQTSTAQGRLLETDKQIKAAERYLKRLEFHLAKIEELHDYYLVQQQLREGTRTMHRAYITSPGRSKDTLTSVKYGMKECSQTMCAIEAQLEAMMGTFHCKLRGMAGFARLCPGDVFEITVRHGMQKWKTKGRIEKTGNQRWDNPEFTFKALIGDVLNIKGLELRSFKSVLLGQKSCETKELFSSNPQLMTVSINTNGSLKLSIIITWNPLDGVDESMAYFEVPLRQQSTPRRRPVSVIALNGETSGSYTHLTDPRRYSNPMSVLQKTKDDNFILRTSAPPSVNSSPFHEGPISLQHRDSGFSSAINLPGVSPGTPKKRQAPPAPHQREPPSSPPSQKSEYTEQFETPPGATSIQTSSSAPLLSHSLLNTTHLHFPVALGHSVDLAKDEATNIEDALHNLSTCLEDYHGQYRELEKLEDIVVTLEQVLRKHSRCSSRSSSISISIENALGAFDFLDTEDTMDDVENQGDSVFENVISSPESTAKTADSGIESLAKRLIMRDLSDDKSLREFWARCTDTTILYLHPEKLVTSFDQKYGAQLHNKYEMESKKVLRHLVMRILDVPSYDPDNIKPTCVVTLHQFMSYFKDEGGLQNVDSVTAELQMIERLCSSNPDAVIKVILSLKDSIPPAPCLKIMGALLVSNFAEVETCVENYIHVLSKDEDRRRKAMVVFVEGLEDKTAEIRAGACVALSILQATESIDQLAYLCQTDTSTLVRSKCKTTLVSLGDEGWRAFEEAQLTTHGFQGLQVRM